MEVFFMSYPNAKGLSNAYTSFSSRTFGRKATIATGKAIMAKIH